MDAVNQGLARLAELVKSMTPQARLVATLALVVVAISVAWLFASGTAESETFLMGGELFSTAQLREMEGAFGKAGLQGYEIDGARVRVPRAEQARYMAALAEGGALPPDFGAYLRKAVDGNGFMLYGPRQEAQLKIAIQSELQGVINHFQGIEQSFVQIAEETSRGFPQTKTVTAAVSVIPARNQPLDQRTASAIRWIVASAWGGLKPEGVTVADMSNNTLFAGPLAETPESGASGQFTQIKKQLEHDWQEKIARLLGIPGATVTTNVELAADGRATRSVSVAVSVPRSYFAEVWRQHAPPPQRPADQQAWTAFELAERERIKQAILPLLEGVSDDPAQRSAQVAVTTTYAAPSVAITEPKFEELALAWATKNWQPLGVGLLAITGLLVLRSAIAAAPKTLDTSAELAPAPAPTLQLVADDAPSPYNAMQHNTAQRPAPQAALFPAGNLREELADVVRQDPAAAASVLRTWIGNAS